MSEAPFKPFTDQDFKDALKRVHESKHGLVLEVQSDRDLDLLKRRIWEWNKRLNLGPISCRKSPTNPKRELWVLKAVISGEEAGDKDKEVHGQAD